MGRTQTVMQMKWALALVFVALIADNTNAEPGAVEELDLRSVLARAFDSYPELSIVAAEREGALALRSLAVRTRFFPAVQSSNVFGVVPAARGSVFDSPDTPRDLDDLGPFARLKIEASLPLYTFGGLGAGQRAAEALIESKQEKADSKRQQAARLTVRAYFGYLLASESLEIIEEVQGRLEALTEKREDALDDEGESDPLDALRLRGYGFELDTMHAEVDAKRRVAADALRELVGNGFDRAVRPKATDLTALTLADDEWLELDQAVDEALATRPDLREVEMAARATDLKADMMSKKRLPELALQGRFEYGRADHREPQDNPFVYEPFNTRSLAVVLGMKWDLSFPQLAAKVRKERAGAAELWAKKGALEAMVRHGIAESRARLESAQSRHHTSRRALSTAANWFRLAEESFDLGNAPLKDVIESYGNFIKLRSGHVAAVHELNLAIVEWRLALGRAPLREGESP